jgi:hypothetical protein
VARAENFFE